jgi:hypothetical protein
MIVFIAAVVVSLVLFLQDTQHRRELNRKGMAPVLPPMPLLEAILSFLVGCMLTMSAIRMALAMVTHRPSVVAIDNATTIALFIAVGVALAILGARGLVSVFRQRNTG